MKKDKIINVTDALMGTGKTCNLSDRVNKSSSQTKWFIVTPLLTETIRISNACPQKSFHLPEQSDTTRSKEPDLIRAVNAGKNIVTTHSMFEKLKLTPDIKEAIDKNNYQLVIDETIDVISLLDETKKDISLLFDQGIIAADDNGCIHWLDKDYVGKFKNTMQCIKSGNVYWYKKAALRIFPMEKFDAFHDIEILTYLFEGSPMHLYLSSFGYSFKFFSIQNGVRVSGKYDYNNEISIVREKIQIYNGKFNDIGESCTLTSSWFKDRKRCNSEKMKAISQVSYNFLYNTCHARCQNAMWTILEAKKERCVIRGYKKSFLPCNSRATNGFMECKYLVYLLNRYSNPIIKHWFSDHGVKLDDDRFALSELIQWIWRSAIRNDQEIKIFIPSARMRKILNNWLISNDNYN